MLIQLESEFWGYVQSETPPPLDGSDASANFLANRFPNSTPKSQIALPDSAADLIAEYAAASEQEKVITEQKKKA